MSLYLCVFRGDEEIDGVDVGSYADFGRFRDTVAEKLEAGQRGSLFPTLQLHADSEGDWSPAECRALIRELEQIEKSFSRLPPIPFAADQEESADELGLEPKTLAESFIDVDGETLLSRLGGLCRTAVELDQPILFQ